MQLVKDNWIVLHLENQIYINFFLLHDDFFNYESTDYLEDERSGKDKQPQRRLLFLNSKKNGRHNCLRGTKKQWISKSKFNNKITGLSLLKEKSNLGLNFSNALGSYEAQNTWYNHFSNKDDCNLLQKKFYERQRDVLANNDFDRVRSEEHNKWINNVRKQELLFVSPVKLTREQNYSLPKARRYNTLYRSITRTTKFNKESMMYQTHQIKNQILKDCTSYTDTMFFYIKDDNYQNFIDLYDKHKTSYEVKDEYGNTFLNLAVQCDCEPIVEYLLKKGSNVNTQNKKGNTPLHYALAYQNYYLSDLLIKFGADEKAHNIDGLTPWEGLNSSFMLL